MKRVFTIFLGVTLFAAALPSFAQDEKCTALSNLASTIYRNKSTINEYQMLRGMEFKSKPIDFAFIKLFSGVAYVLNKLPADQFRAATDDFCQRVAAAAMSPELQGNRADSALCKSMIDGSNSINAFRRTGDNPASIRRFFDKAYSENNSVHRIAADYLHLMAEMRFSNLLDAGSDEMFVNFSRTACAAFSSYVDKVEKNTGKGGFIN